VSIPRIGLINESYYLQWLWERYIFKNMNMLAASESTSLFVLQAKILKVLAHPQRLEIIQLLRIEPLTVTQLYQMLELPQPKISQHLMILRRYGIVAARRDGKSITYILANEQFSAAHDAIREAVIASQHQDEPSAAVFHSLKDVLETHTDPVCGMKLSARTAAYTLHYREQQYYFCASRCHHLFEAQPERYLSHA